MSFHSVLIQKLLSTNAHIGRRVTGHHFKIFSEGTRNSVSVIDSDKTLICLRSACNFIGNLARSNARFLFVNTNSLFDEIVSQMTRTTGIKNDNTWRLGGFLTNSSSPKKFRGRNKKLNLSAVQPPDCIVILDAERTTSVIQEAYKLQIPVVGLVDSSMSWDTYKKITYPVPANDSVEFVYLFCNLITKTILKERKEAEIDMDETMTARGVLPEDQTDAAGKKIVFSYENIEAIPEDVSHTKQLLDKLVVLKFNNVLGTQVGFNGPKCAVEISDGLTCLDSIINQIEVLNAKYGCNIPLVLVNAVNTHEGILKVLEKHSDKNVHSVIQSQPDPETAGNFELPSAKEQDNRDEMDSFNLAEAILPLVDSGKFDILLSQGKEYILMLSSDNVAHVVDPKILNHLIQHNIECCLEVMPKPSEVEESESSQNQEDTPMLTPKKNWRFIDTMWMDMNLIAKLLVRHTAKEQLTASKLFDQYFALNVPKSRYLPVAKISDLFLLKSDIYTSAEGTLIRNPAREKPTDPSIELGPEFVNDFHKRFKSIPNVLALDSLKVTGDVWFGDGITLKGKVSIHAQPGMRLTVPDGAVLENRIITSQWELEA
ncbi:UTP--glucose-1-phosphate uridylyltransferase-like [Andrographis paniculata]|uniref:UTP--glucose-1-phosphate uridylyltransferase-like n=1 Tax=Andrographis paniculata TaxID=175694 RepID=UPI0021E84048|nr:UTP--glucose-1-phosphate uridylyltransferase-like [Andrographis paniculata]